MSIDVNIDGYMFELTINFQVQETGKTIPCTLEALNTVKDKLVKLVNATVAKTTLQDVQEILWTDHFTISSGEAADDSKVSHVWHGRISTETAIRPITSSGANQARVALGQAAIEAYRMLSLPPVVDDNDDKEEDQVNIVVHLTAVPGNDTLEATDKSSDAIIHHRQEDENDDVEAETRSVSASSMSTQDTDDDKTEPSSKPSILTQAGRWFTSLFSSSSKQKPRSMTISGPYSFHHLPHKTSTDILLTDESL